MRWWGVFLANKLQLLDMHFDLFADVLSSDLEGTSCLVELEMYNEINKFLEYAVIGILIGETAFRGDGDSASTFRIV